MFRGENDSVLNRLRGYLLTCEIPEHESQRKPQAVSIVDNVTKENHCCEANYYLKLNYNDEEKNDFAVFFNIVYTKTLRKEKTHCNRRAVLCTLFVRFYCFFACRLDDMHFLENGSNL